MGLPQLLATFLLAIVATSSAFNTLVPHDKEIVYDYKVLVKAGTHFPAPFASWFRLHGKLHVQADTNSTHVKFTDITYQLYNGQVDHVREYKGQQLPLTSEVQDLTKVFKIVHDPHGNVIGIVTDNDEKEYTRNIKRAIAAILQIDTVKTLNKQQKHDHAFVAKENCIYGYSDVNYNVYHRDEDTVEVHKMHYMAETEHLYMRYATNKQALPCSGGYEDIMMHDSLRTYTIVNHDGHQIVKHIEAGGDLYHYPFETKSDSQYVHVNHTFHLDEIVPIKERFHVKSEHFTDGLTYQLYDESVDGETVPDLTNGRSVINYEKVLPKVYELLGTVVHYLNDNHIDMKVPDIKSGQTVNRLQRYLVQFDLQHLEQVNDHIVQQTKDPERLLVYHHMLPIVGTKAAAKFIKKLILQKRVSDETAVKLLENLPFQVLAPTKSLLEEMQDIYKMNDADWEVRKAGILAFGSLVNQCHRYQVMLNNAHKAKKQHHDHEDHHTVDHSIDQEYERYVVEYVNKLRQATDFKEQMVYMHGLFNMKLHNVVGHLKPIIDGEVWPSHHLRLIALQAVAPVILHDQDEVYEILWPIFSSYHEHPELRMAAYYFIMESEPSLSRLMNMHWRLLHDSDEEMYTFHYTFVKSMSQTVEPCKQEFRMRLLHVLKYMHPPSHGLSSAQFTDYKDMRYGFSGGYNMFHFNTNVSQIFMAVETSTLFRRLHEESVLYVKLHGHKVSTPGQLNMLTLPNDAHLEVVRMRDQQIYTCHYVDSKNTGVLSKFFDFVKADKEASFVDDYLQIYYEKYHKVFIPTDIGMVAVWDYMMPVVEKTSINTRKEVADKLINFYVDNRHVKWQHSKLGLSLYNPIVDAWQGVHRYVAFDSVTPVHFDVSLNLVQKSLKISWKKHDHVQKDIMGIRSHVQQMVYFKDNSQTDVLKKSCPQCEDITVVTNGKDYRNDYIIQDEDDLTTGQNIKMAIFDCGYHVSNGSVRNFFNKLAQPYTKNFDGPLQYLTLFFANRENLNVFQPKAGIYGVMLRIQPSQQYTVSNIDLSIRVNFETAFEGYTYTPASKISSRVTYAVKNKEQSLKTWDVNTLIDLNHGHTVNSLKMLLTRIVPGQQDYKVCVDGVKKWTANGVTGHLNVATSQTPDGKCVKDDTVVDVTMVGEKSHEQLHEKHVYGTCQYAVPYTVEYYKTLKCLYSHSTVRDYTYNIKTTNVPSEFKKMAIQFWDFIKGYNMWNYVFHDEHTEDIGEHNMRVHVNYPMQGNEIDVELVTPQYKYELSGVGTSQLQWIDFFVPDSRVYPKAFMYMHSTNFVDHCHVHHNYHYLNQQQVVKDGESSEWVMFVGDDKTNPKHAVYVKQLPGHHIAVKIIEDTHVFQMIPQDDTYQITLDNQVVTKTSHQLDWVNYKVFERHVNQPAAVMIQKSGIFMEYDGHKVTIVVPKSGYLWKEQSWIGHCYEH